MASKQKHRQLIKQLGYSLPNLNYITELGEAYLFALLTELVSLRELIHIEQGEPSQEELDRMEKEFYNKYYPGSYPTIT